MAKSSKAMSTHHYFVGDMATDSPDTSTIDDQIAYHTEMEHAATRAGDFTKAGHHKKMQEILSAMKQMQPQKTPEQISD